LLRDLKGFALLARCREPLIAGAPTLQQLAELALPLQPLGTLLGVIFRLLPIAFLLQPVPDLAHVLAAVRDREKHCRQLLSRHQRLL